MALQVCQVVADVSDHFHPCRCVFGTLIKCTGECVRTLRGVAWLHMFVSVDYRVPRSTILHIVLRVEGYLIRLDETGNTAHIFL
jgi:hypothetical protein